MKKVLVGAIVSFAVLTNFVAVAGATVAPPPVYPTTADECKQYGWEAYNMFKNQGDCVSFVVTDGRNAPAGV